MDTRLTTILAAAGSALTVAILAACGSPDEGPQDGPTAAESPSACVADDEPGRALAGAVEGATYVTSGTVETDQGDYVVAVDLTLADGTDARGIWLVGAQGTGTTLAVDNVAATLTEFPSAAEVAGMPYPNDYTRAAEGCVG